MTLDAKIKYFRHSVGLTQAEMARKLGIGRSTYTNIERGITHPTELFLNCLCATFGLDKEELCDESVDAPLSPPHISSTVEQKFNKLEEKYKSFILKQIDLLLELQEQP